VAYDCHYASYSISSYRHYNNHGYRYQYGFAIGASEIWLVEAFIRFGSVAAADISFGIAAPNGCTIYWNDPFNRDNQESGTAGCLQIADTANRGSEAAGEEMFWRTYIMVINAANAGYLAITYTQNASNVNSTYLHEGGMVGIRIV